jgi:hypothetical protein
MSPEVAVLLGVITTILGVGIPLIVRAFSRANDERHKIQLHQVRFQTMVEMLLDHAGFDMHKVNKAIKQHEEELKQLQTNGGPSLGCIDTKQLYKDKEVHHG